MKKAPSTIDHDEILQAAGLAADGASQILLNHYGNLRNISEKDQAGLVSEADRESEAFIVGFLKERFPEHQFLGEELGRSGGRDGQSGPSSMEKNPSPVSLWIIDPLDGTTNYVHQFPMFCISIALEVDGELTVGVVDAPLLKTRYTAIKGRGAFLNGKQIRVSDRKQFKDGLFATGFSPVDDNIERQFALIKATVQDARGIRRAGAAALDLCFVAEGVFDLFWEKNLQPWDTAAGALIAREAGAIVTDFKGRDYLAKERDIIAGTPAIYREFWNRFQKL